MKRPKIEDYNLSKSITPMTTYWEDIIKYADWQEKQKAELLKALKEISISLHFEVIRRIANEAIKNATI